MEKIALIHFLKVGLLIIHDIDQSLSAVNILMIDDIIAYQIHYLSCAKLHRKRTCTGFDIDISISVLIKSYKLLPYTDCLCFVFAKAHILESIPKPDKIRDKFRVGSIKLRFAHKKRRGGCAL